MSLDNKTRKQFRSIGHQLAPVVIISTSLSEGVMAEINRALNDHELIKVKINTPEREDRKAVTEEICSTQKAELVQSIGKVALIYRKAEERKVHLSNICRFDELLK